MTRQISLDEIRNTVREVVAERPEFVYPTEERFGQCTYLDPQEGTTAEWAPSCVIGHALVRLGVPVDDILPRNDSPADDLPFFEEDGDAASWALVVQRKQDRGIPWGEALTQTEIRWGGK